MGVNDEDQSEVIAFLENRETYGSSATAVERIDTHSAMVFLVADRAYKLKRAVRFSYLDFSTIERRQTLCRAEVALNKRTAPELYLEVRSITREADGSYAFDGTGTVLDYVVVMRRFDQNLLFDRLAARGALDDGRVRQLSVEVARFHAAAERTPGHGGRASLEIEISGNDENLRLAPPDVFVPEVCEALVRRWRANLDRNAASLDRRDEGGKVRRCHGDLHLRNIFLWHDRPTLFDCIEFSEHLACIDVLYDLAFLLMDLLRRGLRAFANLLFNAYLDLNDESDGIGALGLMMSLRAAIRAHTGVAAAHAQPLAEDRQTIIDEARAYLILANDMLHDEQPRLIAIGGLSGTGKSTLARALGPGTGTAPGARLLHTDALRKGLFGVAKTERLSAGSYTPAVNETVYRLQREAAKTYLRNGYSVIVDGVFSRPDERAAIAAVARDCGVEFSGLWLTAAADVLRARVARRTGDMSDAGVDVLEMQLAADRGAIDWTRIEAGARTDDAFALARLALRPR